MSQVKWITRAGLIGSFAEEEYIEYVLDAYDTIGLPITYKVIAGDITHGLQLFERDVYDANFDHTYVAGTIQGIPIIEKVAIDQIEYEQTFTVRATNSRGNIADRTFSIIVNSLAPPRIIPRNVSLGTYYDGFYLDLDLVALESNPMAVLTWELVSGELPEGVTLATDGRLSGFLMPYTTDAAEGMINWDNSGWNIIPWDAPVAAARSKLYEFKVRVFDGAKTDETNYSIYVVAKSLLTVDNTSIPANTTYLTADMDNKHNPIIITLPQELPEQRQNSNFAFKIDGLDLDGAQVFYEVITTSPAGFDEGLFDESQLNAAPVGFDQEEFSLPPGLQLDPVTGWLFGNLEPQVEERKTYTFQIFCYKVAWSAGEPYKYSSFPVTFTLTVLGDLNNVVDWHTPEYLGMIDNGDISELFVFATARLPGKVINYRLKEGLPIPNIDPSTGVVKYTPLERSKLPQGMKLLPDGLLVGRPTFDYFTLDGGTTTIDKGAMNFDYEYRFTITASDETETQFATVSSDKTFVIRIKNYNKKPFENVYLRALPTREQRENFTDIINNDDIFPPELLYRPSDPWFGKAANLKLLFAAGMNPTQAADYIAAMEEHHFNKRIIISEVKTAIALDENFKIKYEVVYVDVVENNAKVKSSIDRTAEIRPQYRTDPFSVVYPNSFDNMKAELATLGYANRGALPDWMLDQQEDGRILGFVRGIILAYTKPGASKLIAYRLTHDSAFKFNTVDFVADRYQLDHYLSKNYDIPNNKFIGSRETTFDRLAQIGGTYRYAGSKVVEDAAELAAIEAELSEADIENAKMAAVLNMTKIAVNYAVEVPFDQINGRTLNFIAENNCFAGAVPKEGQYLIFAKQEGFTTSNNVIIDNDGWNQLTNAYGSRYDSAYGFNDDTFEEVKDYSVIKGYNDKILNGVTNQRGGIWLIHVTEANIVLLEFVIEINTNEYVQVIGGYTYGDTKMIYSPVIAPGATAPGFAVISSITQPVHKTTHFDMGATRFFSNRDIYAIPETDDIWLKFPKHNIYQ